MFQSIHFANLKTSPTFGYASDIAFFKKHKTLEFFPGLNVLFGPNGCGKSTILKILAQTMCAEQGGVSCVTHDAFMHMTGGMFGKPTDSIGVGVVHDGQPVVYCDTRRAVGLDSGHFDDDFMSEGLKEVMANEESHGEQSIRRFADTLGIVAGKKPPPKEVVFKTHAKGATGERLERWSILEKRMNGTCEKGAFSILMDEPESNLSLSNQHDVFSFIDRVAVDNNVQVIVASHSPFALGLPNTHYVDMAPGYMDTCITMMKALGQRLNAPAPV